MRCGRCHTNQDPATYCGNCGYTLESRCSRCGTLYLAATGHACTRATSGEHTEDHRKFAITVLVIAIAAVLVGAGITVTLTAKPDPLPDFLLERALVGQSDLSSDFKVEPELADSPEAEALTEKGYALADKCVAGRVPTPRLFRAVEEGPNRGYVDGQTFVAESPTRVAQVTGFAFDAPEGAAEEIDAVSKVYECVGELVRPVLGSLSAVDGLALGDITTTKVASGSLGSSGVAVRVRAAVSSVDGAGLVDVFFVLYGSDRVVGGAAVLVAPGSAETDTSVVDALARILASKVPQAAGAVQKQ